LDQEVRFNPEAVINRLIRKGDELAEKYLPLLDLPLKERLEWRPEKQK
jgi:hypothetical protein